MLKFLNSPTGSWFKAALVAILSSIASKLRAGVNIFSKDNLNELLIIAILSIIPVIINYLNPEDTRYGNKDVPLV